MACSCSATCASSVAPLASTSCVQSMRELFMCWLSSNAVQLASIVSGDDTNTSSSYSVDSTSTCPMHGSPSSMRTPSETTSDTRPAPLVTRNAARYLCVGLKPRPSVNAVVDSPTSTQGIICTRFSQVAASEPGCSMETTGSKGDSSNTVHSYDTMPDSWSYQGAQCASNTPPSAKM